MTIVLNEIVFFSLNGFLCSYNISLRLFFCLAPEAHNMVPRSVQVVDHVVENSNKASSNQRFIPYKVLIGIIEITLNARKSTVDEDHASKISSYEFNLPAIQFLSYQKKKCIKSMYKIKVVWLSSLLRLNSLTLRYEQAKPIENGKKRHKNIFAQVKQFIMTDEKYITCFSETRFNSKYLPIDESDLTPKMFSSKFPAMVLFSLLL